MESAVEFIVQYEYWIYALLLLAALYYIRLYWQGMRAMQATLFGLEKEHARGKIIRSLSLIFLLLVVAVSVFFTSAVSAASRLKLAQVSVPASGAVPTVIYGTSAPLTFPSPTAAGPVEMEPVPADGTPPPALTPTPSGPLPLSVDTRGCLNPAAQLTQPGNDARLGATVEIFGTADIRDFAFYKFEFASYYSGGEWITLTAGAQPVVNGRLGVWDTSNLAPGLYAFRLVVVDRSGQSPLPCVIAVEILPRTDSGQ